MDWVITLVPEAIYGFGTFLIGFFWRKSQDNAKHYRALEKGVEAILLLELRRIHERGAIKMRENKLLRLSLHVAG